MLTSSKRSELGSLPQESCIIPHYYQHLLSRRNSSHSLIRRDGSRSLAWAINGSILSSMISDCSVPRGDGSSRAQLKPRCAAHTKPDAQHQSLRVSIQRHRHGLGCLSLRSIHILNIVPHVRKVQDKEFIHKFNKTGNQEPRRCSHLMAAKFVVSQEGSRFNTISLGKGARITEATAAVVLRLSPIGGDSRSPNRWFQFVERIMFFPL